MSRWLVRVRKPAVRPPIWAISRRASRWPAAVPIASVLLRLVSFTSSAPTWRRSVSGSRPPPIGCCGRPHRRNGQVADWFRAVPDIGAWPHAALRRRWRQSMSSTA
ncbi:hypothetical protein EFP20_11390 [Burkholderia glumae]|nr:hypothetical protein EFP20_11390 [Burkholderia glumae]